MVMYAGKGLTGLLIVAVFAVAAENTAPWPRSKPSRVYRSNMDMKQVIEHVMLYEEQWTDVLQEPIKGLGEPPYKGRAFPAPPVVSRAGVHHNEDKHDDTTVYDVREIMTTVFTHYRGIRSFVEYAAKAVRRALSCHTFRRVSFQLAIISMMIIKNTEPIIVLTAADALKKITVAYMDVLAAVPDDDMTVLFHVYWEAANIMQNYERVYHLIVNTSPNSLLNNVNKLSKALHNYISTQCHDYLTDDEFIQQMGIRRYTPLIKDPSLEMLINIENLVEMSVEQAKYMIQYTKELRITAMDERLWLILYFGKGPLPKTKSDLFDTTLMSKAGPSTVDPNLESNEIKIEVLKSNEAS